MENNRLNEEQLENVTGGSAADVRTQIFFVGDKVLLRVYPEYGVGTVRAASIVSGRWQLTVQFNAGMMTADQSEFMAA